MKQSVFMKQKNKTSHQEKLASAQKLSHFGRALINISNQAYNYIENLISGPIWKQNQYNDYIFSHLANIFMHELNSNVLKYASRFVLTLILLGNIHIYQRFITYLLPVFINKITQSHLEKHPYGHSADKIQSRWPLKLFCIETIWLLSEWLPNDFYDQKSSSHFVKALKKCNIKKFKQQQLKFITVQKIMISYRIIKSLNLLEDENSNQCQCTHCRNKTTKPLYSMSILLQKIDKSANTDFRSRLYLKKKYRSSENEENEFWNTGFQIQQSFNDDENCEMIKNQKAQESRFECGAVMFNKLAQGIGYLSDELNILQKKMKKTENNSKTVIKQCNEMPIQSYNEKIYKTPQKIKHYKSKVQLSTASRSNNQFSSSKKILNSPDSSKKIKQIKISSAQHIQCPELEYHYLGCQMFRSLGTKLTKPALQAFKQSLIVFEKCIYLQQNLQSQKQAIFCLSAVKPNRIKIKIYKDLQRIDSQIYNNINIQCGDLKQKYNVQKQQFEVKYKNKLTLISVRYNNKITYLPIGYFKILELKSKKVILQKQLRLSFKIKKSVRISNELIGSYEKFIQKLIKLQKKLIKNNGNEEEHRAIEEYKLKRKFERLYKLFDSELHLIIYNNFTNYIDAEIRSQESIFDKTNATKLMDQLCFICQ